MKTKTFAEKSAAGRLMSWTLPVALLLAGSDLQAGKGGGKPGTGGGTSSEPCVGFLPFPGASILNDDSDGVDPGTPYCHDPKAKVTVSFTQDGHMTLDTNSGEKATTGRDLHIDLGTIYYVYDTDGVPVMDPSDPGQQLSFSNTDQLTAKGIEHDVNLHLGAFQSDFNLFDLNVGDTHLVNLSINLTLRGFANVFIKLAPVPLDNLRHSPGSDAVLVTRMADADGRKQWLVQSLDVESMTVGPALASVSHHPFNEPFRDPVIVPDQSALLNFAFVLAE